MKLKFILIFIGALSLGQISAAVCLPLKGLELSSSKSCPASFWSLDGTKTCLSYAAFQDYIGLKLSHQTCFETISVRSWFAPLLDNPENGGTPKTKFQRVRIKKFLVSKEHFDEDHVWFQNLNGFTLRTWIQRLDAWRWKVGERVAPWDSLGLFRTLILDLRPEPNAAESIQLMRERGIIHVATEAGVHLYALQSLIVALVLGLARFSFFKGREHWLRPLSTGLSFMSWFAIWLVSGMRGALLRPLGTLTLRLLTHFLDGTWDKKNLKHWDVLGVAAFEGLLWLGIWMFYPLYFEVVGIWFLKGGLHYYGAVLGGRFAVEKAVQKKGVTQKSLAPQSAQLNGSISATQSHLARAIGSWIWLSLMDLIFVGQVAPFTPFYNLVTLPVFVTLLFPVWCIGLAFMPWSEWFLRETVLFFTHLMDWFLQATTPFDGLWMGQGFGLWVVLIFCSTLVFKKWRARLIVYMLIFFYFGSYQFLGLETQQEGSSVTDPKIQVDQLDVGQGDSALVFGQGHAGLIDVGSAHTVSPQEWRKRFAKRGITALDFVLLTHLDEDHAGGLKNLVKSIPIHCVYVAPEISKKDRVAKLQNLFQSKITVRAQECIPLKWKREVQVLAPQKGDRLRGANASMSAVLVRTTQGWYVNLGDSDQKQELKFLPRIKAHLSSDSVHVLKLSHHGSKSSTHPKLVAELAPRCVWISAGVGNHYGHPTPQALARVRAQAHVGRTDLTGTLRATNCFFKEASVRRP